MTSDSGNLPWPKACSSIPHCPASEVRLRYDRPSSARLPAPQTSAQDDRALALRAVELAYLAPNVVEDRDGLAERLSVSRRTVYRLLQRGTHVLATILATIAIVADSLPDTF